MCVRVCVCVRMCACVRGERACVRVLFVCNCVFQENICVCGCVCVCVCVWLRACVCACTRMNHLFLAFIMSVTAPIIGQQTTMPADSQVAKDIENCVKWLRHDRV